MHIKGSTRLISLLGDPVNHSLSPYMHNLSFENLGLDYAYMAFEIKKEKIKDAVDAMKTLNVRGFNVTMPYKEKIIDLLDEVDNQAKIIGSVNTVLNSKGKLLGYNTDGKGFVKALEEKKIDFKLKKVLILGSGGAAKSIAIQLALEGVKEIIIANRTIEKANIIVNIIKEHVKDVKINSINLNENKLKSEIINTDILVNTTSIGMREGFLDSPIKETKILHKDLFVADIIYKPQKTKLLSQAQERGCNTMNGLNMLIFQGALAFKIWTGKDMPNEVIDKILNK